jgi:hypothetical protein
MGPLDFLSYIGAFLMLCITIGGLVAYRRANVKQLGELQQQVISAYKEREEVQEKQMTSCKEDILRLTGENIAMRAALKQLGWEFEIKDGVILLIDTRQLKQKRIMQIHLPEKEVES